MQTVWLELTACTHANRKKSITVRQVCSPRCTQYIQTSRVKWTPHALASKQTFGPMSRDEHYLPQMAEEHAVCTKRLEL